jgi:hypothetical protein
VRPGSINNSSSISKKKGGGEIRTVNILSNSVEIAARDSQLINILGTASCAHVLPTKEYLSYGESA